MKHLDANDIANINAFTQRWGQRFTNASQPVDVVTFYDLAEECRDLNFELDQHKGLHSMSAKYPGSFNIKYPAVLPPILRNVNDLKMLCSAVYTQAVYLNILGKQLTKLSNSATRCWFVFMLNRISELSRSEDSFHYGELFRGKCIGVRIISSNIVESDRCLIPEMSRQEFVVPPGNGICFLESAYDDAVAPPYKSRSLFFTAQDIDHMYIKKELSDFFRHPHYIQPQVGEQKWKMLLYNETGDVFVYRGPLGANCFGETSEERKVAKNISDRLRMIAGEPDIYGFNDPCYEKQVSCITLELESAIRRVSSCDTLDSQCREMKNLIVIDRYKQYMSIEQHDSKGNHIFHQYDLRSRIVQELKKFPAETLFRKFGDKKCSATRPEDGEERYKITVEYSYGEPYVVSGVFIKDEVPLDYLDFASSIASIVNDFGIIAMLSPREYYDGGCEHK